jgi:hypothetical protein
MSSHAETAPVDQTLLEPEFPLYVMKLWTLLSMDRLEPHEVLRAKGEVVLYDADTMSTIIFVSQYVATD